MIELAFIACLVADRATCREESLLFADVAILTCMVGAQPQLAQWTEANPEWAIDRWSCRMHDPDRRAARL